MFGLKLISKKQYDKEINENIERRNWLEFDKQHLENKLEKQKKHMDILSANTRISVQKQQFLTKGIQEIIETYNAKVEENEQAPEELIKALKKVYSELFNTCTKQFSLLYEISEVENFDQYLKIQERIKKFVNEI